MRTAAIASFAMLVASAAANLHLQCVCVAKGYNEPDLTEKACVAYNNDKYEWGSSQYDPDNRKCKGHLGGRLAGNQWESACQDIAKSVGYKCDAGVCHAQPNEVRGGCL